MRAWTLPFATKRAGPCASPMTISLPSSGTLQTITACLCTLDWIDAGKAAAGGPLGRGVGCIRRWPRLNHLVALTVVVTKHRFLSDGVACKSHRQSDRSDKAFDHGSMLPTRSEQRDTCASVITLAPFRPNVSRWAEPTAHSMMRANPVPVGQDVGPAFLTLARRQQFAGRTAACWVPVRGNEPPCRNRRDLDHRRDLVIDPADGFGRCHRPCQ
jgi:hypothetical protein